MPVSDPPPAAVEVRGLVKVFGLNPALVGVDLFVPMGTVCALFGGNGAGKTTLLRCVATALRPTAGTVRVMGRDVCRHASHIRRLIDLVPVIGGAYPELSGRENLQFALAMRADRAGKAELARALEDTQLAAAADDPVRTYSTGMVRRLALARILLTRPAVLLLDEPYAALDDAGRDLVDAILVATRAEGRTALVATHDRERASLVADAAVQLEGGAIARSHATRASAAAVAAPLIRALV